MRYEYLESHDYQKDNERLKQFQAKVDSTQGLELTEKAKEHIELRDARARVHRAVEAATGLRFNVTTDIEKKNVAAFIETDSKRTFIGENTLDDKQFALYAARHELRHKENGVMHLDLDNELETHQERALISALGISELDPVEVLEGFNDWETTRMYGGNSRSGYTNKEVPMAQKLEQLALENGVGSLKEVFHHSKLETFYERLALLGEILAFGGQLEFALAA